MRRRSPPSQLVQSGTAKAGRWVGGNRRGSKAQDTCALFRHEQHSITTPKPIGRCRGEDRPGVIADTSLQTDRVWTPA